MFSKILIANRGEIAIRVARACREMGIASVAVYSEVDRDALHVRAADEAYLLGPAEAAKSYLNVARILAVIEECGADAVHPGYGFLAENAPFAKALEDAGITFIGPPASAIDAMGSKTMARELMQKAGVPIVPGTTEAVDTVEDALRITKAEIGFPVAVKASGGGGGKGFRVALEEKDLKDAFEGASREGEKFFSDGTVYLERYLPNPRHVEVQILADTHGNVIHLGERDCSIQRRHQKVIEEAPAPGMDAATREILCGAAIRAAKAVDYVGAGTIEFIADASDGLRADRIWFMEMNTRLQVEHPVTEEITGVDLVEWQLRVASGEALPLKQDELAINGHAIEARLYAEDPAKGFLPSVGKLERFRLDERVRVETGVEEGSTVSPFYDPMIAKVIAHSPTREAALDELQLSLADAMVWPVKSNAAFLVALLQSHDVRDGKLDTGFIAREVETLTKVPPLSDRVISDAMLWSARRTTDYSPMTEALFGFRMNQSRRTQFVAAVDGQPTDFSFSPTTAGSYEVGYVETDSATAQLVTIEGNTRSIDWAEPRGSIGAAAGDGAIIAPMPGKVTAVDVAAGDTVTKGQRLLTLEAMKMEHGLVAPFDGVVAELNTSQGAQVQVDAVLARIEKSEE